MAISPLAGKPAPKELLVDLANLERAYYERRPDVADPNQLVAFGTSGHRGSSLNGTFTEAHILAITQAICDYWRGRGTDGPLYMGKDTHALSGPAQRTALQVLAANGVETIIQCEATLKALADHGEVGPILPAHGGDCEKALARFAEVDIDVRTLAARLQDEGAKSFVKSWQELLEVIASKSEAIKKAG